MTGITPEGFEIDRDFAAPPSAVFAAWTTAEHFARWFGGKDVQIPADRLHYKPTAGRAWSATMVLPDGNTIDWTGQFLEVVPDKRLVLTMTDQPGEPGRLAITVEFSPTASGTHMHMTQEAPDFTDEQRTATIAGWQTFFDVLQQIAEAA
ncbi:MAG: SRPBCC family protein [Streptosporangiaceae bacterium]